MNYREKTIACVFAMIIAAILLSSAYLTGCNYDNSPSAVNHRNALATEEIYHHRCEDSVLCPQYDDTAFVSYNKPGTDEYSFDSIHWEHPTWTYKQTEDATLALPGNTTPTTYWQVVVIKDSLYLYDERGLITRVKYHRL